MTIYSNTYTVGTASVQIVAPSPEPQRVTVTNTHTILISQLNKAFTGKDGMTNYLPNADRLFGSGTKQDATNIIFIYWEKIIGKQTIQVGADKNVSSNFVTKIITGKLS